MKACGDGLLLVEEIFLRNGAGRDCQRRRFQSRDIHHVLVVDFKPEAAIRLFSADLAEYLIAAKCAKVRQRTDRWIVCDVLCDADRLADGADKLVAENARRVGGFAECARAAGEFQLVVDLVFGRVEEVGTVAGVSKSRTV